ncbi:MAG: panE [Citricoccus sp.]|nr:panE [Citricoccus sp. WCRC_4]
MRITVVGAGAMGQLVGARLALAGEDVVLLDTDERVRDTLSARGVTLHTEVGTEHTPVTASRAEDVHGPVDLVVVFTKGFHTRAAVDSVGHLIGPDTLGLTLQNGLGHADVLADAFGADRTIAGVTDFPADLVETGRVHTATRGSVRIGGVGEGDGAAHVAEVLNRARLNASVVDDVRVPVWEKVAFNAALNTVSAITGATVGGMGASVQARRIVEAVMDEVAAVAAAEGVGFSLDRVRAAVGNAFAHHGDHKSSMLIDREAGRRTEVDFIGGAVVERGRAAGIPTPVLATLCDLVRMLTEPGGH